MVNVKTYALQYLKYWGKSPQKITAVSTRMVNALCLLLALNSELGQSDTQLDSAGIPHCGTNNMFP